MQVSIALALLCMRMLHAGLSLLASSSIAIAELGPRAQASNGVQVQVGLSAPTTSGQLVNNTLTSAISSGELAGILNANGVCLPGSAARCLSQRATHGLGPDAHAAPAQHPDRCPAAHADVPCSTSSPLTGSLSLAAPRAGLPVTSVTTGALPPPPALASSFPTTVARSFPTTLAHSFAPSLPPTAACARAGARPHEWRRQQCRRDCGGHRWWSPGPAAGRRAQSLHAHEDLVCLLMRSMLAGLPACLQTHAVAGILLGPCHPQESLLPQLRGQSCHTCCVWACTAGVHAHQSCCPQQKGPLRCLCGPVHLHAAALACSLQIAHTRGAQCPDKQPMLCVPSRARPDLACAPQAWSGGAAGGATGARFDPCQSPRAGAGCPALAGPASLTKRPTCPCQQGEALALRPPRKISDPKAKLACTLPLMWGHQQLAACALRLAVPASPGT